MYDCQPPASRQPTARDKTLDAERIIGIRRLKFRLSLPLLQALHASHCGLHALQDKCAGSRYGAVLDLPADTSRKIK
ncbi:MAG TPA: hypothetical protein PKM60_09225 [Zoogloea sp.]|uniref:hypothetical protein n=1 Tax=Zoogloea sp. TaxID=49181 RepID=UPI002C9AA433|nr:hypothetical protein [Zoogloea sp.]HOB46339.1 hypothetical protein [Zoogloea sp.]HQA10211.1 hypothetical protein [Zoogloea sp.]HQE39260.1 hypothetical protein [Zoogloea sp.]